MSQLTLDQLHHVKELGVAYAASLEIALWIIAITGVVQLIWGFSRDAQFLKKNSESTAWDNERSVLLQNYEKAEKDCKSWERGTAYLKDVAEKQGQIIRNLRTRLQKAGVDDTE